MSSPQNSYSFTPNRVLINFFIRNWFSGEGMNNGVGLKK